MSSSDSVLCLPAWFLHTNVFQPGRLRARPLDLTSKWNNYKLKKITPTFLTRYKVIRGRTAWACNYSQKMLIFCYGVLTGSIRCILTIIKFTVWHADIYWLILSDLSLRMKSPSSHLSVCWTGLSTGATCYELEWIRIQGSPLGPATTFKKKQTTRDQNAEQK